MASAEEALRRLGAAEDRIRQLSEDLEEHRAEIVRQNERHQTLVADLRAAFDLQVAEVASLKSDVQALQALLAAGRGGSTGLRLVDARIMDKPSKFWGKASEWKDWSDGFVAFA